MKRPILGTALAIASAVLAVGAAAPAFAVRTTSQLPLMIIGTDSFCASWTTGMDGTTGTPTLTCNPAAASSAAPSGCVATVNGGPGVTLATSAGGTVNLAASCTTPASGVTYAWSRNGASSATTATWSDVLPANTSTTAPSTTSYQVQACNGTACLTVRALPLTVTVPAAAPTTGGGGGGGSGSGAWNGTCPGFNKTLVLAMNWVNPVRMYTGPAGGVTADDAVVVAFTTGSVSSPDGQLLQIIAVDFNSRPSTRNAVLSATPCDFGTQPMPGAIASGTTIGIPFAVGSTSSHGNYPALQTNTTYYLNIKNVPNTPCTLWGNCDLAIDLDKPGGM